MIKTTATLFTGGGGFDVGAIQAGYKPTWGVEIDPYIAKYAALNAEVSMICEDVATVDYNSLERPYHLHASPVCKNASVAKQGGGEAPEDLEMAAGIVQAIKILQPSAFSLENVYPYRKFQSFKNILQALHNLGYAFDYWHLNSADYGVPQTRRRLILIARKDKKPTRPQSTHKEGGQVDMFGELLPWVGWYEAIEDLIPDLPESEFALWQLERLPEDLKTCLVNSDSKLGTYEKLQPSPSVVASRWSDVKAFIVDGVNVSKKKIHRSNDKPMFTVTSSVHKGMQRAYCFGKAVSMTPRALARFQSIPNWYKLPDKKSLACTIIGNMVPPLLAQRIMESIDYNTK